MMLRAVADILQRRRMEGWLVGGSVRDANLGRPSPDLDVVVAGDARTVAREIADALGASWFSLSRRHPAYRVIGLGGRVDVAPVRGGGILADLAERDFTINAMAVPVGGEGLIDPFRGLAHLRKGRLVAVSERIFTADPLRLMRVPRFCHLLGFQPDVALAQAVKQHAPALAHVAAERVTAEMVVTLAAGRSANAVRLWHDLGLLPVMLPEVVAPDRLAPTLALLARLEDVVDQPETWFPATAGILAERLARSVDGAVGRPTALRLAGLMHRLAARDAVAVGKRLKLSGALVSLLRTVSRVFSEHGEGREGRRPLLGIGGTLDEHAPFRDNDAAQGHVVSDTYSVNPDRASVLFLWNTAPWEPEVILLETVAAVMGDDASGAQPIADDARLGTGRRLMALWGQRAVHGLPRSPVDGEVLMREFDLDTGPLLGRVLREVRLAWEAGEAVSAEEALAVARDALEEV